LAGPTTVVVLGAQPALPYGRGKNQRRQPSARRPSHRTTESKNFQEGGKREIKVADRPGKRASSLQGRKRGKKRKSPFHSHWEATRQGGRARTSGKKLGRQQKLSGDRNAGPTPFKHRIGVALAGKKQKGGYVKRRCVYPRHPTAGRAERVSANQREKDDSLSWKNLNSARK